MSLIVEHEHIGVLGGINFAVTPLVYMGSNQVFDHVNGMVSTRYKWSRDEHLGLSTRGNHKSAYIKKTKY
jgi:hypothetical protein